MEHLIAFAGSLRNDHHDCGIGSYGEARRCFQKGGDEHSAAIL